MNSPTRIALSVLVGAGLLAAREPAAAQAAKPTVAIMYFNNNVFSKDARDYDGLTSGGQVDRETAVKVGKLLGAQHMIFGGFMADPKGNFRIDARAVNVETGAVEYTDRVQDHGDNVMALIGQLANHLNAGLKLGAPTRTGGVGTRLPMRVAVLYGKALDMADRGDKAKAVELFGAVLKEFPDYAPAKNGLAKVKR